MNTEMINCDDIPRIGTASMLGIHPSSLRWLIKHGYAKIIGHTTTGAKVYEMDWDKWFTRGRIERHELPRSP